ncbi:hypothetical protein PIIN_10649 [Serendipita indica DSM 11827]|uniref:WSC domain-containing protein n=1 Tax=Serendipita indica (strain DSM 11827) TaxID=1109443 RepID=G4TZB6_SERID|nr:hypothetical protein PIIN_10649 [Serendipita indica DSM 11827]
MACSGDVSEFCGGSNGLSVYHSTGAPQPIDEYNGSTFSGCYKDSTRNRVLPHRAAPEHNYDQTIEICIDACNALGYAFAGVEYASECWCGDARPAELATDGRCNMQCVTTRNAVDAQTVSTSTKVILRPPLPHRPRLRRAPRRQILIHWHLQVPRRQKRRGFNFDSDPTIFPYRVAIYRTADESLLGYIAEQNGPFILPTYTTDPAAALLVVTEGPKPVPQGRTCFDLLEVNPPDISHPYLAAYYEFWVDDSGTIKDRYLYYYGSGTTGYFMSTVDPVTFESQFPTALPVRFVLEEVLPLI